MKNRRKDLDQYIKILRAKFPRFDYCSGMRGGCPEASGVSDRYYICVKNIQGSEIDGLLVFVRDVLYTKCITEGQDLPTIIPIQIEKGDHDIATMVWTMPQYLYVNVAEDFPYGIAA